jgi:predicted NBD/HSP70 family sugar kinase
MPDTTPPARGRTTPSAAGRRVADALRQQGPQTRAQLSRATGMPKSSVSAVVAELQDLGLVLETGPAEATPGGRGRPGTTVSLDPTSGAALGLDFGFRHLRVAVVDVSHQVLLTEECELGEFYAPERALEAAAELVESAVARSETDPGRVLGVGAAVALGMQRTAPARPGMRRGWDDVDFDTALRDRLARPTLVDNDANCAAHAELLWGAGRGYDDFVYFKLHTGVGGAVVLGREVRGGRDGGAGEFGHLVLDPAGPLCRCGAKGCLETYASIPAMLRVLEPWTRGEATLAQVVESARAGDPAYRRVVTDAGAAVGRVAGMLCNALNPQAVVIGGALSAAGDVLLDEVRRSLRQSSLRLNADVDVVCGSTGRYAGALGAAALVLTRSLAPV